jgi:hypothetical protein
MNLSEDNKGAEVFLQIRRIAIPPLCAVSFLCLVPFVVETPTRNPGPPISTKMRWRCVRLPRQQGTSSQARGTFWRTVLLDLGQGTSISSRLAAPLQCGKNPYLINVPRPL